MAQSMLCRQSTSSVLRPAAFNRARASASIPASSATSGPRFSVTCAFSHEASAGLKPDVETATLTGPWRAMAGRMNEQDAGAQLAEPLG